MKIELSQFNSDGASAGLVDSEDNYLAVVEGMSYNAKSACKKAAERLRKAAERFDKLATMDNPFNEATHNKVNSQ